MLKPAREAVDPVCGMTVAIDRAAGTATHKGETYYFCSSHCVAKFKANPRAYVPEHAAPAEKPATRDLDRQPATREGPRRELAKDPICGMMVERAGAIAAGLTAESSGRT